MGAVIKNPWLDIKGPPYIASVDKGFEQELRDHHFELDVLPDPFLGNLQFAKVVCLLKNPGFQIGDVKKAKQYFVPNRDSLIHKSKTPFYVLNKNHKESGGYNYWRNKILKKIFMDCEECGMVELEVMKRISTNLMCIQYFPYHSTKWNGAPKIESQQYSFSLVRKAIVMKKNIVLMRCESLWLQAVPELRGKYVRTHSPQNPVLTPVNLGENEYTAIKKLLLE